MEDPIIRAAIVEQGRASRSRIRQLLALEGDIRIVAECGSGENLAAALAEVRPDLLFLDTEMPRGSAFELLELLRSHRNLATIFVAKHNRHALKAFEYGAIDYLLKPVDAKRFLESLARARESVARFRRLPVARDAEEPLTRLAVKRRSQIVVVRMADVDWIDSAGNYVRLHVGATQYLHRHTLADFARHLDRRSFVRIHRSAIVNVDRISYLEPSFRDHVVVMRDGSRLRLSHAYRHEVESCIGRF